MTVRCDGSLHAATASRRSTHAGSHICTEKQCNLRCADNHRAAGGGAVGPRDAAGRQHAGGVQALPARRRHQQPARQGHREPGVCAARGRRPAHLPVHGAPLRRIGLGPFLSLRRRLPAPTPIPAQETPCPYPYPCTGGSRWGRCMPCRTAATGHALASYPGVPEPSLTRCELQLGSPEAACKHSSTMYGGGCGPGATGHRP
jgi:hypothetical protein